MCIRDSNSLYPKWRMKLAKTFISLIKNVWKSDRRWEPENLENLKTWKLDNLKTLKTLKSILGTSFVFMSMLKSRCKFVKCVRCVKCVKCSKYLCWSLGHNEQLLFSCLCSKVAYVKCQVSSSVICQVSSVKCQMLKLIAGTCWTTFVFMSMLKSRCLKLKMSMLFFGQQQPPHPLLWVCQS